PRPTTADPRLLRHQSPIGDSRAADAEPFRRVEDSLRDHEPIEEVRVGTLPLVHPALDRLPLLEMQDGRDTAARGRGPGQLVAGRNPHLGYERLDCYCLLRGSPTEQHL